MACVNISGVLYHRDSSWNASVMATILAAGELLTDDSLETLDPLNLSSTASTTTLMTGGLSSSSSGSSSSGGVVCMFNPEQMLEPWEINKNLGMIASYSVIFVIGVLGNITAMLGMIGDRKSRNATTLFLVSLSAADLLLLLVCAPLEVLQYFVIQWDEVGTICKTAKYAEVLSAVASVLNLTAVSLERFIVIVFPIRSRSVCTMSNCRRAVLVVWIVSLLLTAPVLFTKGTNPWTFTDGEQSITIYYCEDKGDGRIFAIYLAVILLLAPGLVMIICYTYVIRELWISTRNMRVLTNTSHQSSSSASSSAAAQQLNSQHEERTPMNSARGWRTSRLLMTYHPHTSSASSSAVSSPLIRIKTTSSSASEAGSAGGDKEAPPSIMIPCPCSAAGRPSTTASAAGIDLLSRIPRPPPDTVVKKSRPTLKQRANKGHQARAEEARNARKQVIKMLVMVIALFLVCWGSRLSMEISIKVGLDNFSPEMYVLRIAINLLPYVHSCLNPLIYSLMSKNFRRAMIHRLRCLCRCCCSFHPGPGLASRNGFHPQQPGTEFSSSPNHLPLSSHYNDELLASHGPTTTTTTSRLSSRTGTPLLLRRSKAMTSGAAGQHGNEGLLVYSTTQVIPEMDSTML